LTPEKGMGIAAPKPKPKLPALPNLSPVATPFKLAQCDTLIFLLRLVMVN